MNTVEQLNLMNETLGSAHEYINNAIKGIESIVFNLQSGREDIALPNCTQLFEGINWLVECMDLTKPVQEKKNMIIDVSSINNINQEIIVALENNDYVLLGDLLEYELKPVLEQWKELMDSKLN